MRNVQKYITPLGNYDVPTGWPMKPYKRPYGGTPGPPVMYEKPSDLEDEGAGYGYFNGMSQQERDVFFYHSDHLGSTSYITDRDGNATQFVCYKPYGEALVDEHATSYKMPWKFNGKELDRETGLYYYGARYYEPMLALWYGVDKLAEKYPNMGGYVYCVGNPVRLVDVDGNDWVEGEDGIYWNNDVNSATDKNLPKGEKYIGKEGYGINPETGNAIHYKQDGTTSSFSQSLLEVTVTPTEAHITDNPSYSSKNQEGYYWNDKDLEVWSFLRNGNSPISTYVRSQVKEGYFDILSADNYWKHYGQTLGSLKLFSIYCTEMIGYASGPSLDLLSCKGFSIKYLGGIKSTKPTFSEYLHMTKGQYKGIKGRGNAMKAAAVDYHKIYGK